MLSTVPTTIVTIGDSLSDSGNIFDVTSRLLADPLALPVPGAVLDSPGYAGVFSDGPVHAQRLAELLGAELAGYAVGGARIEGTRSVGSQIDGFIPGVDSTTLFDPSVPATERAALLDYDINVDAQVARVLGLAPTNPTASAPALGETTLLAYFAGSNDFADFAADAATDPLGAALGGEAFVADLLDDVADHVGAIVQAGLVSQVALYEIPLFSFFAVPAGTDPTALSLIDGLIEGFNAGLQDIAAGLGQSVEAVVVETNELTTQIEEDPETFGFLGKGPFYAGGGTEITATGSVPPFDLPENPVVPAGTAPEQLQFFDLLHPSSSTHALLGAFTAGTFVKETQFLSSGSNLEAFLGAPNVVFGEEGEDRLFLGRENDVVLAGPGSDLVFAGLGDDVVAGGAGDDDLRGGAGDDVVAGNAGNDAIRGGAGDDILIGGSGGDEIFGGLGDDTIVWVAPEVSGFAGGADTIAGQAGSDTLFIVLDAPNAALQSEIDGRSEADIASGTWTLSSIGVTATGIEQVEVLTQGLDALDPQAGLIGAANAEQLDLAAAWGLL